MEEAALLAAIVAAPEDDGPRLVLADWLQQRGDPWGELIVLDCELERRDDAALAARYNELYEARFPDPGLFRTFERGFFTEVQGSDFTRAVGPEYALLHTATLVDATFERLHALAAWPPLARVATLKLEAMDDVADLGEAVPPIVAAAQQLRTLELMAMDVSRADIDAMFAYPHARELRGLGIMSNHSLAGELFDVAWPALTRLDLGACSLMGSDIDGLFETDALVGLRELELSFNSLGDGGAEAVARYPFAQLATLELQGSEVSAAGVATLAAAPHLRGLKRLAIGGGFHGDIDEALPLLATAFPDLVMLGVESHFPVPHLAAIARPLHELTLRLDSVDPAVLDALLSHPALRGLSSLSIQIDPKTAVGDAVAEVVAAAELPGLSWLRLFNCGITARGGHALARARHLPATLDLMIYGLHEDVGDAADALRARFARVSA
jgi:uncharacterized protein (TIGR02996 family)